LTVGCGAGDIVLVSETIDRARSPEVSAVLCVERRAFERFGRILRHFCVGLVDQAIPLRIVGSDARIRSLCLGPVQAVVHRPLGGLAGRRRAERVLDELSARPPTLVHAVTCESYRVAASIADEFEADLVFGVTSLADCDEVTRFLARGDVSFQPWTQALADVLESQLRIPVQRIEVVPPGIPVSARVAAFDHPDRAATLVSTARFEGGSGMDRLILAVAQLVERGNKLQVFLLGDGECERSLRKLVRTRNLSSSIAFAPPMDDPAPAIQSADVFVHPSQESAFTADTLQAMGLGVAVVTAPNDVVDHHRHGETAMVCPDATPSALAGAIETLLHDRAQGQRLAVGGLEYVRLHHGVSAMAERVAASYRKLALTQATFPIRK